MGIIAEQSPRLSETRSVAVKSPIGVVTTFPRRGLRQRTLLIIDPTAMVRRGLAVMLSTRQPGLQVFEAGDLETAARIMADDPPDLVLIDVDALGRTPVMPLRRLVMQVLPAPVIALGMREEPSLARQCLAAGAHGYVCKGAPSSVLENTAALMLEAGDRDDPDYVQVPRWALAGADPGAAQVAENALDRLTSRQRDIFLLLQEGCSNKEIARRLGVLEGTVKVHVRAVMQRLGLRNRTQVAILGARQGCRTMDGP